MRVHVDKPWNDCLPIDNDHFGTIRHSNTISRPYLLDPAILDNDRSIVDDLGATHRDNICTFDGKQCRHNTRRHNEIDLDLLLASRLIGFQCFHATVVRIPACCWRQPRTNVRLPEGPFQNRTVIAPSWIMASFKRNLIFYAIRSEEHTSELQSLMRISYAVFCLKTKKKTK